MIFTQQLDVLDGRTDKEAIKSIANHIRRMQEELEYRLSVLDSSNISQIDMEQTSILTAGGELRNILQDQDGRYSGLQQTIDGLAVRVGDAEGSVTSLSATTAGLQSTVASHTTGISDLQSTISQTASTVGAIVQGIGQNGKVTAASIVMAINQAAEGSSSFIGLSADAVNISSEYVMFSDLENSGYTYINGDNIRTGTIRAVNFVASGSMDGGTSYSFVLEDSGGYTIGNIGYQYVSADGYYGDKMWIRTIPSGSWHPAIKIEAAGGVSIESLDGRGVYIYDGTAEWMFKSGVLTRTMNGTSKVVIS